MLVLWHKISILTKCLQDATVAFAPRTDAHVCCIFRKVKLFELACYSTFSHPLLKVRFTYGKSGCGVWDNYKHTRVEKKCTCSNDFHTASIHLLQLLLTEYIFLAVETQLNNDRDEELDLAMTKYYKCFQQHGSAVARIQCVRPACDSMGRYGSSSGGGCSRHTERQSGGHVDAHLSNHPHKRQAQHQGNLADGSMSKHPESSSPHNSQQFNLLCQLDVMIKVNIIMTMGANRRGHVQSNLVHICGNRENS